MTSTFDPWIASLMSVTSSGRSSIRRMIRYISGLFRRMDFAASFKSVVFPAFGGETIMPRWPFPIGLTRSTIRIAMLPPGRSRRSRSSGKTGVISSKLPRRMIWSSGRLLTLFKYKRALNFSVADFTLVFPRMISPVFSPKRRIWDGET